MYKLKCSPKCKYSWGNIFLYPLLLNCNKYGGLVLVIFSCKYRIKLVFQILCMHFCYFVIITAV